VLDVTFRDPLQAEHDYGVQTFPGEPQQTRLDNGPEFVGVMVADWAEEHGVHLEFIKPGEPTENSYVERFNRTYREEVLDSYLFSTLDEVRGLTR